MWGNLNPVGELTGICWFACYSHSINQYICPFFLRRSIDYYTTLQCDVIIIFEILDNELQLLAQPSGLGIEKGDEIQLLLLSQKEKKWQKY